MDVRPNTKDYRQIFLSNTPLLDLRAPCEFIQGSFPTAVSLPLMSDQERQKVGTCYKQKGQEAAIELGYRLVSGAIKNERLERWKQFVLEHPDNGYLFCFRGGLRSRTVQAWLAEEGIEFPLIEGGYKALRRFLIDTSDHLSEQLPFYIIAGLTGSAKTTLLQELDNNIDLEALANHRGSSFGRQLTPQPSQVDFENKLAIAMLKLEARAAEYLILEDEGRLIGARSTPLSFFYTMQRAPLIMVQETFDNRVEHIYQEYVVSMYSRICQVTAHHPMIEDPLSVFGDYLLTSIDKIKKRLGGDRHRSLRVAMSNAIEQQAKFENFESHYVWIRQLLEDYYDPMYHYQLQKKLHRIIFQGSRQEVIEFARSLDQYSTGKAAN